MADRFFRIFTIIAILGTIPLPTSAELLYSTLFGGTEHDGASSIVRDASGNVYVTGSTSSPDFPTTAGAYDESFNTHNDAFIILLSPQLDQLLAGSFIGGTSVDEGRQITLNGAGEPILLGGTLSEDFPVTPGAWDQDFNGEEDLFILKMSSGLDSLHYSTFFGGSEDDWGNDVTVAPSGDAVFTGSTRSLNFPVSPGCFADTHSGGNEIFVTRFSIETGALVASTYIPNSYYGSELAIDHLGNIIVCGTAGSGFPTTAGAFDQYFNGGVDFVVFSMEPDLSGLKVGTYLGGSGNESYFLDMALDQYGNVILAGWSSSPNYPTTPGCLDDLLTGYDEAVISILTPHLDHLVASTFCQPGTMDLLPGSISVSAAGEVVLTGTAYSPPYNDVFVLSVTPSLDAITSMNVFGGGEHDGGSCLSIDESGVVYCAGRTESFDFPTTAGAFQTTFHSTPGESSFKDEIFISAVNLVGYDTLLTGLDCYPRTITLPGSAQMSAGVTNVSYSRREIAARLNAKLPDGTVVENLGFSHRVFEAGETYQKFWVKHFPNIDRLDGIVTFQLYALDVTPAPWNQPPYPPSGQMDTSELPIRIIVP
jgi:hypothetical protein